MNQDNTKARNANYNYRAKYPNEYICKQGLNIYKFEKDYDRVLEYKFFNFFPKAISSMPVTYDGNDVLRCNVTMSYVRYIMTGLKPNLADRPSSISTDEPKTNRPNTSPSRRPQVQPEPEPAPVPTAVLGIRDLGAGSDLRPGAGRFTNTGTDSIFPLGRV